MKNNVKICYSFFLRKFNFLKLEQIHELLFIVIYYTFFSLDS